MAFWFILAGGVSLEHLGLGLGFVWLGQSLTRRLLPRPLERQGRAAAPPLPLRLSAVGWVRAAGMVLLLFVGLLWELVLANWAVAMLVLRRRVAVEPVFYQYHPAVVSDWGRVALANAVTLTPGTVAVSVSRDQFLVHALTQSAAASLPGWSVERRLERLEQLLGAGR